MKINSSGYVIPWPFIVILLMVILFAISGGVLFYSSQKKKILYEKQNELAAIITLKAEDLTSWRLEHIRDGISISNDLLLNRQIKSFLENQDQKEIKQELLQRMKSFINNYDYQDIFLMDNTGTVILSVPETDSSLIDSWDADILNQSMISFVDLHSSKKVPYIHMDMVVPLISPDKTKEHNGTLVLRINPEIKLFPLIQTWPAPSKSSETLLLRREGDSVLFLNDLRHKINTALKLKASINNKKLPAAMAASGSEGSFEGNDYRNIPVISSLKKIPDSPWFMVAKVDKEEIFSPLRELTILILIIASLVILSAGAMTGFFLRRENESRLQELNLTKDKFFTIISHDLKSPFTSILGFSELLIERAKKKDLSGTEKFATVIYNSSQNAMDLLANLTQWSRLQTGRMEFNPKEVDIVEIINEVTELLSASALHKNITITRNLPAQLNIMADRAMISTVIRNLISNSIKFTKSCGEISLTAVKSDNEVLMEVKDNGVGISKEALSRLFRIEAGFSTRGTKNEEGTGLGLILCKEFISRHAGKIWAEGEAGKGSRFFFTLPV